MNASVTPIKVHSRKELKELLREYKYEYLDRQKAAGGYAEGFRQFVAKKNLVATGELHIELFDIACDATWRVKHKGDGTLDLMIGGKPCEEEITYEDATAPGGKVTVLRGHSTLDQFRRHCVLCQKHSLDVMRAVGDEWDKYEILRKRCNDNPNAPISKLGDDLFGEE